MSENTTYDLTVKVSTHNQQVTSETQYGVQFPDGSITWGIINPTAGAYHQIHVVDLVRDQHPMLVVKGVSGQSVHNWKELLKRRADEARIDIADYAEMHTLMKRTLMLSATAAEEV
ncbi:hypothetical protein PP641_gp076 [Arthrobacter phage SilentRX]|uniref:Uncharacterized protein n=1 Tax=Arthrobacter phage SilentRX TaxID=2836091 RepID=A0A8F3E7H3_9CAUD|nr:hypothetical protein PP641_gp076 [Arthrobacter phage SilentRX]QWY82816.1 hypothetical protein SEA_SILENTRX_76 [Arthrobacter phage SilentRX]